MKLYVHSVVNVISERSRFNNMSTILERSLSGKSLYFDVDTTKSVLALKKQAGAKLFDSMGRVNIAYQSMTFNDRELDDTLVIGKSGLKDGNTIVLRSCITVK
jgi:hypothetical protein